MEASYPARRVTSPGAGQTSALFIWNRVARPLLHDTEKNGAKNKKRI